MTRVMPTPSPERRASRGGPSVSVADSDEDRALHSLARSAEENPERGARSVARLAVECVPHRVLGVDELLARSQPAPIGVRQQVGQRERIVDEREQEHEVESLRIRDVIDTDRQCLADDRAEQRRPGDVT